VAALLMAADPEAPADVAEAGAAADEADSGRSSTPAQSFLR
jgi:hypothetical protein